MFLPFLPILLWSSNLADISLQKDLANRFIKDEYYDSVAEIVQMYRIFYKKRTVKVKSMFF